MMVGDERKRFVRARQRSRTALKAFAVPLVPAIAEIGVDRMQIGVHGSWRLGDAPMGQRSITPEAYIDALGDINSQRDWFRKAEVNKHGVQLLTKARARTSLGSSLIRVRGLPENRGTLEASIACNPTATLAHLMAFNSDEGDFVGWLNSLSPFSFFDRRGVIPSLDNGENWLPNLDAANDLLGPDVFGTFFPIFVTKLMDLVARFFAPFEDVIITEDGTDCQLAVANLSATIEWGRASVPQIETYFERHHSEARSSIKSVAQAMLASLDETRVRHHLHRVSFERQEDLLSVRSGIPGDRDLSIYAKAPDRIRFEITRPKRGRYEQMLLLNPHDRLMQIFRSERNELPECCDWDAVGTLFEEPAAPAMSDLVALSSAVSNAASASGTDPSPIFEALLVDGGIRHDVEQIPDAVVSYLVRHGILERVKLRKRNKSGELRYCLRPDFRWLIEDIANAFASHIKPRVTPDRQ